jgi:hypothetical protein
MKVLSTSIVCLLLAVAWPRLASPASEAPANLGDVAARARSCFLRGVELYEERDFGGAGVEFRRAYELVRNFRVLFNLGRVAVELHDYASAIDFFGRYLAQGGEQVPAERRHELQTELAHLRSRVGQVKLLVEEVGAEVYLDDVVVGRTPVAPLTVNVGRHRIELRPQQGPPESRVVDVPGEETVAVRMAIRASKPVVVQSLGTMSEQPTSEPTILVQKDQQDAPKSVSSSRVWLGWTATGLCAAGAAVSGVMAYRSSKDLGELRESYPVTREALDSKQRTTRTLGAVADGFAAAALVLGGLSLYFSFDHEPKKSEPKSQVSVGLSWPSGVNFSGQF